MSDSAKSPAPGSSTAAPTSNFSEREMQLLSWAMQSLKSGPPEVGHLLVLPSISFSQCSTASHAYFDY